MKAVSAKIASSKPISVVRAARFLSNFVDYDNGASHAITTYLRRTSDAFNELSEFHKKLKSSGSNYKRDRSYASSGISIIQNEPSMLSAQSSEGEKVAEKRKEKNRKKEMDEGQLVHIQETGVTGSQSVPRNAHGEDLENDFDENLDNGVEDISDAVIEKKQHKKKHARKVQDNESAENGGEAQEVGDDLSEKSSEKKRTKKKKKGGEGDDSLLPNGINTGKKEVSEGRYENIVSIGLGEGVTVDLSEESSEKKSKRKKRGEEGHDSLLPNGVRMGEREISEAKSGSEEGKDKRKKKRKIEEAASSMELDGLTEHRNKKAKKRMSG